MESQEPLTGKLRENSMKAEGCSGLVERVSGSAALSSQRRTGSKEEKFTSWFQRLSPSRHGAEAGWSSPAGSRACTRWLFLPPLPSYP